MQSKEILKEILEQDMVYDENNNSYELNSNIDEEEGAFLINVIVQNEYT